MLAYLCDWCKRPKQEGESWILGIAAERSGPGANRGISIASSWSDEAAAYPLAVHFCCEEHQREYIAALFRPAVPATMVPRRGTRSTRQRTGTTLHLAVGSLKPEPRNQRVRSTHGKQSIDRRARRPRRTAAQFDEDDAIRSHGLGVSLGG